MSRNANVIKQVLGDGIEVRGGFVLGPRMATLYVLLSASSCVSCTRAGRRQGGGKSHTQDKVDTSPTHAHAHLHLHLHQHLHLYSHRSLYLQSVVSYYVDSDIR